MLLKLIEHLRKDNIHKFPQKGVVVFNEDPKRLGRVKCYIENRWEESYEKLPWVYPLVPSFLGGSAGLGELRIPEINTELVIEFPFDDEYSPFYTGYWLNANTKCSLFDEDYPETWGWIDSTPQWFRVNKKEMYTEYYNSLESFIRFDKEGNLFINVPKSVVFQIGENFLLQCEKSHVVKAGGGSLLNTDKGISVQTNGNHCIECSGNITSKSSGVTELQAMDSVGISSTGIVAIEGSGVDFNSGIVLNAVSNDAGSLNDLINELEQKMEAISSKLSDLKTIADTLKENDAKAREAIGAKNV